MNPTNPVSSKPPSYSPLNTFLAIHLALLIIASVAAVSTSGYHVGALNSLTHPLVQKCGALPAQLIIFSPFLLEGILLNIRYKGKSLYQRIKGDEEEQLAEDTESSPKRRAFAKVQSVLRSRNKGQSIPIGDDLKQRIQDLEKKKASNFFLWELIESLRNNKALGPEMYAYGEYLESKYGNIKYISNYLSSSKAGGLPPLPDVGDDVQYIAIPVVVEGPIGHVVTFFFDRATNTLEFYDPQGVPFITVDKKLLRSNPQIELADFCIEIQEKYREKGGFHPALKEYPKQHQQDLYNCGAYSMDYCRRRLQGESATEIANSPADIVGVRIELLQEIVEYASSQMRSREVEDNTEVEDEWRLLDDVDGE